MKNLRTKGEYYNSHINYIFVVHHVLTTLFYLLKNIPCLSYYVPLLATQGSFDLRVAKKEGTEYGMIHGAQIVE